MRSAAAARRAFAAALAALLLGGCAARIPYETPSDPLRSLAPGALLYSRVRAPSLLELAPAMLPPAEARALRPLFERSAEMGVAAYPTDAAGAPNLQAVLVGNYPFRSASMALSGDRAWRRDGPGFVNAAAGIRVALPGPTVILAASGAIEPLVERLKLPGPSPLPARLEALAGREVVLYAPEPFSRLAATIIGEELDVPIRGLLIAAERVGAERVGAERSGAAGAGGQEEPIYDATVVFLMDDPDNARIFRPAARLAWYALVRSLFPAEAEELLAAKFQMDGETVAAAGLRMRASSLAGALARLASGFGAPTER
ncbi:MAG: hypothetical protein JNG85_08550 [Spirochaetaceae bacterium]|nr:hypothetical protein [Spirochaetaceae bacterium]